MRSFFTSKFFVRIFFFEWRPITLTIYKTRLRSGKCLAANELETKVELKSKQMEKLKDGN